MSYSYDGPYYAPAHDESLSSPIGYVFLLDEEENV